MSLATLLDDYLPLLPTLEHRRRRNRPLMLNLLDLLENEMDQRVGHVVRRLPAALLDWDDDYELVNGRKRKRKPNAVAVYEPKTKCQVITKDNKFQVQMDTSNYQPDEITVKVVNDKLTISAKHETKADDVYEYHEMTRSFSLPEGVDPDAVVSRLNTNGQLTIEAPMKPSKDTTSRVVPVEMTKDKSDDKVEGKDKQTQKNDK
ncbi:heat shock protein beta-6-like [Argiope bruennichi]|uniref:Heat shock protein beta-6 like protein n=1 Tax=Argiope bruennichi TaxID=94029 RepID=A0A8T0FB40_ARGBR|nr:heat shock protein beta-6-like [Argiope bruennichi]KAF8786163.1 Heat shock protein beta-6 like protein [Argiope bruennichi]